jgi:hypothetical protein
MEVALEWKLLPFEESWVCQDVRGSEYRLFFSSSSNPGSSPSVPKILSDPTQYACKCYLAAFPLQ